MKGLYQLGVSTYTSILHILSPFNSKAKKWVNGRRSLSKSFSELNVNGPLIWFHCASLGEFEQGKPVMESFKKSNPNWKLLVTFFSPSGYEVRKDFALADYVYYLPAENKKNVQLFLDTFNPNVSVFVKYEFWYTYLEELFERKIPVVFVSSTFRNDQIFFKSYGKWFLNHLKRINYFFVQDDNSLQLLNDHGISNVQVSGDTRFDRVFETLNTNEEIPLIKEFKSDNKILVFGSAWSMETEYALDIIKKLPQEWKVIYAPHEIHEGKILDFLSKCTENCVRFTQLTNLTAKESNVLVVDTVGHLARLYKYGDLAFVGGGYTDGIHNILEPLTFGLGVFFGENHKGFPEAEAAIQNEVGFEISSYNEFESLFMKFSNNPKELELLNRKSKEFIRSRIGSTEIIMEYLNKLV